MQPNNHRRRSRHFAAVFLALILLTPGAQAIQFNISSIPGAEIVFTPLGGGVAELSFETTDPDGFSFQIDDVIDGTGSAVGFKGGTISLFDVGPATTIAGPVPLIEEAPISGLGIFGIFDPSDDGGLAFFGTPASASSLYTPSASAVGITFGGVLPVLIDSTDPDLVEFFNGNQFTISFAFALVPGRTLADLLENGGRSAFSGVMTSTRVPEGGATAGLLGLGSIGLWAIRRRISK